MFHIQIQYNMIREEGGSVEPVGFHFTGVTDFNYDSVNELQFTNHHKDKGALKYEFPAETLKKIIPAQECSVCTPAAGQP